MKKEKRENFARRLHSFAGVFPLGVFLCFHMAVNYSANWGASTYNMVGSFMAHMPYKILLETFIIFLPLLFHAIYGVWLALKSNANVGNYHYYRNWKFVFQRITGLIAFLFVAWHIYGTKYQVETLGIDPSFGLVASIVSTPVGLALFLVGLLCCVYHFCNGMWTFLITWGITVTPRSQRNSEIILTIFFVVFAIFSVLAILAFV